MVDGPRFPFLTAGMKIFLVVFDMSFVPQLCLPCVTSFTFPQEIRDYFTRISFSVYLKSYNRP